MPSIVLTSEDQKVIFARLASYLPATLKKIEPGPYAGFRYTFTTYTGREQEPCTPAIGRDPQLTPMREADNPHEYKIRAAARDILDGIYAEAHRHWHNAAYAAALAQAIGDAPTLWKTYTNELRTMTAAFDYLRDPEASREWPSAIARLLDAQDRTIAAAEAFDIPARNIARVHDEYLYSDYGHAEAFAAAGHPNAKDWDIPSHNTWRGTLADKIREAVTRQRERIATIGHLTGTTQVTR
ncbi:hypothetical protein [Streptomyces sp. NPDC008150]|uniref:hypothetical protein n=1 Tax=Streptomyces sp. NPDC008150 TaxID=3364816 RepID=UPI0036EE73ED